jgi:hypothetical protein
MTFEQRKFLWLAAWTASVATVGLVMTIDRPTLWVTVASVSVIPTAIGNWLWNPPEPTLAELMARHRR